MGEVLARLASRKHETANLRSSYVMHSRQIHIEGYGKVLKGKSYCKHVCIIVSQRKIEKIGLKN